MKVVEIILASAERVSLLVNITNRYPFTIQLRQGRYVVDGKSILGVRSLERTRPITVEIYSDHCEALLAELEQLAQPQE